MRKVLAFLLLCSTVFADNPYWAIKNFNAGELSPYLNAREDLAKYHSGCSIMENMIPLPQGGAQKRPGTKYIAEVKTSSLATRIVPFEYSTSQSYVIELGNQYARFYTDGAQITAGSGTEDLSSLNNIVAHWLLNDNVASQTVLDDDDETYNGTTVTNNTSTLHTAGRVGTGCFDLEGSDSITVADAAGLTFDDSGSKPFSIAAWVNVSSIDQEQVILSKWQSGTAREWKLSLDSNQKLKLSLFDDSTSLSADRVAQWKLNENAANTTVADAVAVVPHTGTATANTSTLHATGKVGSGCFDFDGQYAVEVADNDALSFIEGTNGDFSITGWVYAGVTGDSQVILSKDNWGGNREWNLFITADGKLRLNLRDNTAGVSVYRTTDDALSAGWHFIGAAYNGEHGSWTGPSAANYITLYVDGSAADSTATNNANYVIMANTATKVVIGAYYELAALAGFFADKIDNVTLYSITLSAAEVATLYNSGSGVEEIDGEHPYRLSDDALTAGWHLVCSTYNSAGGTAAAGGIILYVDGAAVDSTATNDTDYTAMEDTAAALYIGAQLDSASAIQGVWTDKIDEVSLFSDVLTPAEVAALYTTAAYEITTPYLTADLFELKYEQSADILYIVHPDYEPRKLARYADDNWVLAIYEPQTGPFRTQNTVVSATIAASATTGSVTLTASGCAPFVASSTAGHDPGGSSDTDKSQTGALFELVHPLDTLEYSETLSDNYTNDQTENTSWMDCGTVYKGATWSLTTAGTWTGVLEIQRNYTIGAAHDASGWETADMEPFASTDDRNASTSGTEETGDASYRAILTESGDAAESCKVYFATDQADHIGIVEITSVTSTTTAAGTVLKTLGSTNATYKWSEGAWSNYRGWPRTVTFFEDRLVFGGNTAQPDTIWASVTSDYENMLDGAEDDDALNFTLSSRQVNVIEWLMGKDKILIGTSGAEWTLSGSGDEPLTPSNVKAEQHSSYGSANLQATLANESVLFFQRGAEKMRELAYNWELDSYVAPDMTILANFITDGGITDTAFQKTPDSILWCTRTDGELPVFSYERKENITAWSRLVTADGTSDSDFESVARICGDPEDEIWAVVERTINGSTVRYIEQFQPRDFDNAEDAFYVDCGITDTGGDATITGLTHLEGETVHILGDGAVIASEVVSSGQVTADSVCSKYQVGLPYEVHLRTMPLSWMAQGPTIQGRIKRINEVIANWYVSGDFSVGRDADTLQTYSISGQTTSSDRKTFPPGYDRNGYIYVYQKSAEPLTLLSLAAEFQVQ